METNRNFFFTSLAYQLSTIFPEYRTLLDERIRRDETLVSKSLASQFEELIMEPLAALSEKGVVFDSRTIFIDGLDECAGVDAQVEIVLIIAMAVQKRSTPFRWAIFSRPEPHLEAVFSGEEFPSICFPMYLPVTRQIDAEIRIYLENGFQDILRRYNLSTSSRWPSNAVLDILVDASAGLFVYAATVLRFVGKSGRASPDELLDQVLSSISPLPTSSPSNTQSLYPFATLDQFYTLIIRQVPEDVLPLIQCLILLTRFSHQTQHGWVAMQLGNLLETSKMKFTLICNKLHAVLRFQEFECDTFRHDHSKLPFEADCLNHLQNNGNHGRLAPITCRMGGSISFYHKSLITFQKKAKLRRLLLPSDALPPWQIPKHRLPFLRPANGIPDSKSSLQWHLRDECLNGFLKIHVYRLAVETILQLLIRSGVNHDLVKELEDVDYRRLLRLYSTGNDELDITLASRLNGESTLGQDFRQKAMPYTHLFEAMRQKVRITLIMSMFTTK
ncbi:hypothetical protein NP233_g1171 [Leucocoprinus birnbaumii]|uniref:Nephrocystin 3-like N-terminal domain-containing protein n=1 Tax=Leucocoprinus birnbaumii TaxID=56174 RepID=A0AAD5W2S9_9AGAR|nr:hypothetical protein NP233_g1171 [Leucocoprinus birnbaumii]